MLLQIVSVDLVVKVNTAVMGVVVNTVGVTVASSVSPVVGVAAVAVVVVSNVITDAVVGGVLIVTVDSSLVTKYLIVVLLGKLFYFTRMSCNSCSGKPNFRRVVKSVHMHGFCLTH